MSPHAERVRAVAADIELTPQLRTELACLAVRLDEPPLEVLAEALSELRTLRWVECDEESCLVGYNGR